MSNFENNCLLQNSFLRNDREQTRGIMREYIFLFLFLSFLFSSNKRISTFISRLVNQIHVSHEWLHTRISDYWKFSGCNWIQRTKPIEKRGIGLLLIESAYLTDALINAFILMHYLLRHVVYSLHVLGTTEFGHRFETNYARKSMGM